MDRRDIEKIRLGQSKRASTVGDIFRVAGSDVRDHRVRRRQQPLRPRGGRNDGRLGSRRRRCRRAGRARHARRARSRSKAMPARMPAPACAAAGWRYQGDAGDHLGAPLAGRTRRHERRRADRAGAGPAPSPADRMRRGLIAVLKGCGDYAGCRMIAGTLVVAGGAGEMPGYLMRRGSILLDRAPEKPVAELRRMRRAGERLRRAHRPPSRSPKGFSGGRCSARRRADMAATMRCFGMGEVLFPG